MGEERREVFQFLELPVLFLDLLLRLNGTNNNLLKLLCSQEEGREAFQFPDFNNNNLLYNSNNLLYNNNNLLNNNSRLLNNNNRLLKFLCLQEESKGHSQIFRIRSLVFC